MSETIQGIEVDISVVLGTAELPIHQLLRMGRGAVIGLDTTEDDDVIIMANKIPIAIGNVVLDGELIEISVREVLNRPAEFRPQDSVQRLDKKPENAVPAVSEEAIPDQLATETELLI